MSVDQEDDNSKYILPPTESNDKPLLVHYYRMKAVDDIKKLGKYYCFSQINILNITVAFYL